MSWFINLYTLCKWLGNELAIKLFINHQFGKRNSWNFWWRQQPFQPMTFLRLVYEILGLNVVSVRNRLLIASRELCHKAICCIQDRKHWQFTAAIQLLSEDSCQPIKLYIADKLLTKRGIQTWSMNAPFSLYKQNCWCHFCRHRRLKFHLKNCC